MQECNKEQITRRYCKRSEEWNGCVRSPQVVELRIIESKISDFRFKNSKDSRI
jgi:hypothetical protein